MPRILYEVAGESDIVLTVTEPYKDGSILVIEDGNGNVEYYPEHQVLAIIGALQEAMNLNLPE